MSQEYTKYKFPKINFRVFWWETGWACSQQSGLGAHHSKAHPPTAWKWCPGWPPRLAAAPDTDQQMQRTHKLCGKTLLSLWKNLLNPTTRHPPPSSGFVNSWSRLLFTDLILPSIALHLLNSMLLCEPHVTATRKHIMSCSSFVWRNSDVETHCVCHPGGRWKGRSEQLRARQRPLDHMPQITH